MSVNEEFHDVDVALRSTGTTIVNITSERTQHITGFALPDPREAGSILRKPEWDVVRHPDGSVGVTLRINDRHNVREIRCRITDFHAAVFLATLQGWVAAATDSVG